MNDKRELLELAAKAAGIDVVWKEWRTGRIGPFGVGQYTRHEGFWNGPKQWNPLTDDADALRLAVTLGLRIEVDNAWGRSHTQLISDGDWFTCGHNNDPYAATRLAIVRAAAEIGRNME